MSGIANGSSTRASTWRPLMPIPRAAWRMSSSTDATPTYEFATIGGTASATIAMKAGTDCTIAQHTFGLSHPDPTHREDEQREGGSARPTLATLIAIPPPRRRWPTTTPIGSAIERGERDGHERELEVLQEERRDALLAVPVRAVGEERCDVAQEAHQWRPFRRQGVARVSAPSNNRSATTAERERQHDADGERRLEVALEAVDEQLPEPALADERGDGDETDGADGRDAHTGDDRRHRERQFHSEQEPRVRVYPMPVAASFTSGGTPSRPVTVFRTRMSSVYAASGMTAVVRLRNPVTGPRSTKNASEGIVYMIPVIARVGVYERRQPRAEKRQRDRDQHTQSDREHREHDVLPQARADLVEVVGDPRPVEQLGPDVREAQGRSHGETNG